MSADKNKKSISGFSKLTKLGKMKWLVENFFIDPENVMRELKSYWLQDDQQKVLDGFSENTISNFLLPYGVAPNFVINGKTYVVPMVTEESSVVAAASAAAKFWMTRGGFNAKVIDTQKIGQVHFLWEGASSKLFNIFPELKDRLKKDTAHITANMDKRGGGILDIELLDKTEDLSNYYQLKASFETCDSMGANFINSVLEEFGLILCDFIQEQKDFDEVEQECEVIMAILSNYTPDCLVRTWVECPVEDLGDFPNEMDARTFADRFCQAVWIATIDPYRATTHNKGIFNGIDAVVLATGNDFRAIEACGHTYASSKGQYRSLSSCKIKDGRFHFSMDLPLAVGTVGGLTKLHPIAKRSLELMGNPNAEELMGIIAATGLAQNFAALRSLVTTGIQKGHMKMHLQNILNHLEATEEEATAAMKHFHDKVVSFNNVRNLLDQLREPKSRRNLTNSN
ncbi:MAG: hydroxymethylglutaryl-CoA reductase, degradative [Saprospiraceae bacterium]|nr:hydroxymethylglutaryl-CoA reductase, degradative [Saprospiraceae bacterium]